jgi:hypothetical protein
MTKLFIQAQVITVTASTMQKFNHSSSVSTIDAMALDIIEYPHYTVGENIYVFDLSNKTMSHNNKSPLTIIEINRSNNIIDCVVHDNGNSVLFVLSVADNNESQFLMEWFKEDQIVGFFSMNEDFSYTVE